jgi:hypothetical protein
LYDDYVGLKQPSSRAASTNSQPVEEEDIWTEVILSCALNSLVKGKNSYLILLELL